MKILGINISVSREREYTPPGPGDFANSTAYDALRAGVSREDLTASQQLSVRATQELVRAIEAAGFDPNEVGVSNLFMDVQGSSVSIQMADRRARRNSQGYTARVGFESGKNQSESARNAAQAALRQWGPHLTDETYSQGIDFEKLVLNKPDKSRGEFTPEQLRKCVAARKKRGWNPLSNMHGADYDDHPSNY